MTKVIASTHRADIFHMIRPCIIPRQNAPTTAPSKTCTPPIIMAPAPVRRAGIPTWGSIPTSRACSIAANAAKAEPRAKTEILIMR